MSVSDILNALLEDALVRCDREALERTIHPDAEITDSNLATPTREAFIDSVETLCRALEDRHLVTHAGLGDTSQALCQFSLRGHHIGVAWGVVPVGRRVDLSGSTTVEIREGRAVMLRTTWSTAHLLGEFGLVDPEAPWFDVYQIQPRCHDAAGLISGEPDRTRWARAWGLSPFLARTAVLVMAGVSGDEMASALGVKTSSARTYVRQLYAATGIHGRISLLRAAQSVGQVAAP